MTTKQQQTFDIDSYIDNINNILNMDLKMTINKEDVFRFFHNKICNEQLPSLVDYSPNNPDYIEIVRHANTMVIELFNCINRIATGKSSTEEVYFLKALWELIALSPNLDNNSDTLNEIFESYIESNDKDCMFLLKDRQYYKYFIWFICDYLRPIVRSFKEDVYDYEENRLPHVCFLGIFMKYYFKYNHIIEHIAHEWALDEWKMICQEHKNHGDTHLFNEFAEWGVPMVLMFELGNLFEKDHVKSYHLYSYIQNNIEPDDELDFTIVNRIISFVLIGIRSKSIQHISSICFDFKITNIVNHHIDYESNFILPEYYRLWADKRDYYCEEYKYDYIARVIEGNMHRFNR